MPRGWLKQRDGRCCPHMSPRPGLCCVLVANAARGHENSPVGCGIARRPSQAAGACWQAVPAMLELLEFGLHGPC
jgi:hypothetical protein